MLGGAGGREEGGRKAGGEEGRGRERREEGVGREEEGEGVKKGKKKGRKGEEGEKEGEAWHIPSHAHLVKAVSAQVHCTAPCQHCFWRHRCMFLSPSYLS